MGNAHIWEGLARISFQLLLFLDEATVITNINTKTSQSAENRWPHSSAVNELSDLCEWKLALRVLMGCPEADATAVPDESNVEDCDGCEEGSMVKRYVVLPKLMGSKMEQ
jgi:hypothetical protein